MIGIIGKKIGMTQVFSEAGIVTPVTVLEIQPMVVSQIKTVETDEETICLIFLLVMIVNESMCVDLQL